MEGKLPLAGRRVLAHELNNQLSIILNACDLISQARANDSAIANYIQMIRQAARAISDRISEEIHPGVGAAVGK